MPHLGEAAGMTTSELNMSFITKAAEAQLTNETLHNALSGADLHDPKAHASSHYSGGADALTLTSIDSLACRIKTSSFTGDGGTSQAITGVGFEPKYLFIYKQEDLSAWRWYASEQDNGSSVRATHGASRYATDMIISLNSDGFTVGDSYDMNLSGKSYAFVALG